MEIAIIAHDGKKADMVQFINKNKQLLAKENILSVEVVDFEELGMEAVRKITIKDFPAFIITDDKGNDFFENL